MTTFSLHDLPDEAFLEALRADMWARNLNALSARIVAGPRAYDKLNGTGNDRGYAVMPAVGWIGLVLDEEMDEWSAAIVERERA